jgi:predicted DNA binding CopG/RHH family protein
MTHTYYDLDPEEREIEATLASGHYESVMKPGDKQKYARIARATLAKTEHINIRLSQADLIKLKAAAIKEGLPYQTLAGSIIHKYTHQIDPLSSHLSA